MKKGDQMLCSNTKGGGGGFGLMFFSSNKESTKSG